jgi:hypothetical protein
MGKKFIISLVAWLVISTVGGLFKLMHWPGAQFLLIIGLLLFVSTIILGGILAYKMYQKIETKK